MDFEDRIERHIEKAVEHVQAAGENLMLAGYHAAQVYGRYKVDATAEIARRSGRSISTVKNWVHAYWCFVEMKEVDPGNARILRKNLSMTHLQVMRDLARKHDLDAKKMIYLLGLVLAHKRAGNQYSVDVLKREVETYLISLGINPGLAVDWRYHFRRATGDDLRSILSFNGAEDGPPPEVINWARWGTFYIEKYLEAKMQYTLKMDTRVEDRVTVEAFPDETIVTVHPKMKDSALKVLREIESGLRSVNDIPGQIRSVYLERNVHE